MTAASRLTWWGTAGVWAVAPLIGFFVLPMLIFLPGLFGGDPFLAMLVIVGNWGWLAVLAVWSIASWVVMLRHRGIGRRLFHFIGANVFGALGILCAMIVVN